MSLFDSVRRPQFLVWCPDRSESREDAAPIIAESAESAAELWADHDDFVSNEYAIVGGAPIELMVAADRDGSPSEFFIVTGRTRRIYRARKIEPSNTSPSKQIDDYVAAIAIVSEE